jgi:pimeloyl-ACP methyl ester carboxylesterase
MARAALPSPAMSFSAVGPEPTSRFFLSQRLRLHCVDWGNPSAPPLVLVHGGRDHARSWDRLARALRQEWHVVVPDLRGHGESAHADGGRYALPDFVLDLAELVESLGTGPVTLVGHSLGGAVVLHYAGAHPERVARLVALEGLGPAPDLRDRLLAVSAPQRLRSFVEGTRALARRAPRRYASFEEAAARMREANPRLAPDLARHLTLHALRRNDDGTFSWKFDPLVRSDSPLRPDFEGLAALWANVRCPVLLLRGSESWASDPVKDGRIRAFRDARLVNVEGAGHWMQHDRPDDVEREIREFLAETRAPRGS